MTNKILIFDFGSQYTQLIARRIRELHVYSEIVPFNKPITLTPDIKGVVLSGSPFSVTDQRALHIDPTPFIGKIPVLGVCYGAQYLAQYYGGKVAPSTKREYGKAHISTVKTSPILAGIAPQSQVWMSHGDTVTAIPEGFERIAHTESIDVAAYQSMPERFDAPVYCLQFHPEVTHSLDGAQLLHNFVINICQCQPDWTPQSFVEDTVAQLRQTLQNDHVLMALSGGVDSTVAAVLLHQAIGQRLHCFFVDNGLLRKDEYSNVLASYEGMGLNIKGVQAADLFMASLQGLTNPEDKRKTIGRLFIEVFENEAHTLPQVAWLAQGTIYPDVIESVSVHGPSVTIKSHHNVGGLPDRLRLKIVEPLRMLFKDEVRRVGRSLNISPEILDRHPFPGPGLGIRIIGEVTPAKVHLLQQADHIFTSKLRQHDLYRQVWQAGAVLLPVQSVGVMGDERTYELTVALRCVNSSDGMTAEWSKLPHDFLAEVSNEIINSVKGINRVVYDISTKPPATIEWE